MDERREQLRRRLSALGFDEVRFAELDPPARNGLTEWLAAGRHADMDWMEATAAKRLDPQLVLPGACSAIALGVSYGAGSPARGGAGAPLWARYALNEDYHDTIKPALIAAGREIEAVYGLGESDYRYYTDTGPVLERAWAARAGVGFIGKNSMLISRRHGNWLLLSAILVRARIPGDPPLRAPRRVGPPRDPGSIGSLCGRCTRCLDACPTAAFSSPGVLDARRCVAYQTIENRGSIPRELRSGVGSRVFGCDVCLEVCPWNRWARAGRRMLLVARREFADLGLRDLLEMTPGGFSTAFRRTPVKRIKHAGLLRNACVAAGNSGDSRLIDPLARLAAKALPVVRAHAVWAVFRIAGRERASDILRSAREKESDPGVLEEYAAEETT